MSEAVTSIFLGKIDAVAPYRHVPNTMGQYYKCIILAEKPAQGEKEYIRTHVNPHVFHEGAKLVEHSYCNTEFMRAVEALLRKGGVHYKSRVVWAGDYADVEPGHGNNLNNSIGENHPGFTGVGCPYDHTFIVNHTKKEYVMKMNELHPLPLLTAEGNGRGGGDYHGADEDLVGTWARDVISVEMEAPADYTMLVHSFGEHPTASHAPVPSTP